MNRCTSQREYRSKAKSVSSSSHGRRTSRLVSRVCTRSFYRSTGEAGPDGKVTAVVVALNQSEHPAGVEVPTADAGVLEGNGHFVADNRLALPARGWAPLAPGDD